VETKQKNMKNKITLLAFLVIINISFSSCKKDESKISGQITYIGAISGTEYYADGATVYLMKTETTYSKKTTADTQGNYEFYPVADGTYFIKAEITVNLITYTGRSAAFTVTKADYKLCDLKLY